MYDRYTSSEQHISSEQLHGWRVWICEACNRDIRPVWGPCRIWMGKPTLPFSNPEWDYATWSAVKVQVRFAGHKIMMQSKRTCMSNLHISLDLFWGSFWRENSISAWTCCSLGTTKCKFQLSPVQIKPRSLQNSTSAWTWQQVIRLSDWYEHMQVWLGFLCIKWTHTSQQKVLVSCSGCSAHAD